MEVRRVRPASGAGPFVPVIFCMDGAGLRSSLDAMARRIAVLGYVVFSPDLFHRSGSVRELLPRGSEPAAMFTTFGDPEFRLAWRERFFDVATSSKNVQADMEAVFALIDADPDVRRGAKVGCTGYCMGGHVALKLAGLFGERVGACGSFHGGFLGTESPDSPSFDAASAERHYASLAGLLASLR